MDGYFGVITFKTTHHAIKGDKILKKKKTAYRMIPVPREISHSCGLAIRFNLEDLDLIMEIIKEEQIQIEAIFKLTKLKKGYDAKRIDR